MLKRTILSPCVRTCCLDREDICIGCGRHLLEIQQWQAVDEEQKEQIVALAKQRLEQRAQRYRRPTPDDSST